jgi:sugar phosphate isomerase/epimerase
MPPVISCRTSVYPTIHDAFRLLPDAGIRAVELCVPSPDDVAPNKERADAAGVTIATVGTGVNLASQDSIAAFDRMLAACASAGVPKVFTSISGKIERAAAMAALKPIAARAADLGVIISMETHPPFARNADDASQTMNDVGSPALRMNFDTANVHYYNRDVDTVDELRKVVDRVASVHLKESRGAYESMDFPLFGQGIVDFAEVFRLCAEQGLDGPYTMELEGPLTHNKTPDEVHDSVKACMAHLKSVGVL